MKKRALLLSLKVQHFQIKISIFKENNRNQVLVMIIWLMVSLYVKSIVIIIVIAKLSISYQAIKINPVNSHQITVCLKLLKVKIIYSRKLIRK